MVMTAPLVALRVGNAWLGLDPDRAARCEPLPACARLPDGPAWLTGIAWSEGEPICVVDPARLAQREAAPGGLILRLAGTSIALGIDALSRVTPIAATSDAPFAHWTDAPLRCAAGLVHPIRFDALIAQIEQDR